MGDAYASQQKWAEAGSEYRLALSMIPDDQTKGKMVNAMNNQGLVMVDAGHFSEAAAEFRRALQWDPLNWNARHNLAAALLDNRDAAGAEAEARLLRCAWARPRHSG
jgi:Flp pilus assembly protein TadD